MPDSVNEMRNNVMVVTYLFHQSSNLLVYPYELQYILETFPVPQSPSAPFLSSMFSQEVAVLVVRDVCFRTPSSFHFPGRFLSDFFSIGEKALSCFSDAVFMIVSDKLHLMIQTSPLTVCAYHTRCSFIQ